MSGPIVVLLFWLTQLYAESCHSLLQRWSCFGHRLASLAQFWRRVEGVNVILEFRVVEHAQRNNYADGAVWHWVRLQITEADN